MSGQKFHFQFPFFLQLFHFQLLQPMVCFCDLHAGNVFIGFSVYKNDFGNDELIHRLTLQQSADVLVQKHGYQ